MPIGLLLPAKTSAFVLASALNCSAPPAAPVVSITFDNKQHTLNNTVTQSQLQQIQSSTSIAHSPSETFLTVGTAVSGIAASLNIQFQMLTDQSSGNVCMWMSDAQVLISYAPEILIVRDYTPASCRYRITYEHELRHVNTDIITINEFLPIIKNAVQIRAAQIGTVGPFADPLMQSQQKMVHDNLQLTLKAAIDSMMVTRQQRQQLIDTRQEYLRLSQACPGETQVPPR